MRKGMFIGKIGIRISLIIPIGLTLLIVFATTFLYLTLDQQKRKNTELEQKIDYLSKLIVMTNINTLGNYLSDSGTLPIDQNLSTFLMDREIASIAILDAEGNTVSKFEKEMKGKLVTKSLNINRENRKIGSAEIVFSDYYIHQEMAVITVQFLATCIGALVLTISILLVITRFFTSPILKLIQIAARIHESESNLQAEENGPKEIRKLALTFNEMTSRLKTKSENLAQANQVLEKMINKSKQLILNLNEAAANIESAAQEQTSASNEHASGITEVSSTLQELVITAKQITKNIDEFVISNGQLIKHLNENETALTSTVARLEEAGNISRNNSKSIEELDKRLILINDMVELIKEIANKTNILSINASIEASRSGEAGSGFSVVASEIRELSRETIESVKKAEKAATEVQNFLSSIIKSSENETQNVVESGKSMRELSENIREVIEKLNNNYGFAQKINISIRQQENGSEQAAETMKQMAELAKQSAETSRQILQVGKDIVEFSLELSLAVVKNE